MTLYKRNSLSHRDVWLYHALRREIADVNRAPKKQQYWLKNPNNLISVVAICISILSLWYGFVHNYYNDIEKRQNLLTASIDQLTALDKDLIEAPSKQVKEELSTTLNNRRLALLSEANRLIASLGPRVPISELAALGPEYVQVGEYEKAVKYFSMTSMRTSSPILRIYSLKSLGQTYDLMGPKYYRRAENVFRKASVVITDPSSVEAVKAEMSVYVTWAVLDGMLSKYTSAKRSIAKACALIERLPSPLPRETLFEAIDRYAKEAGLAGWTSSSKISAGTSNPQGSVSPALERGNGCQP